MLFSSVSANSHGISESNMDGPRWIDFADILHAFSVRPGIGSDGDGDDGGTSIPGQFHTYAVEVLIDLGVVGTRSLREDDDGYSSGQPLQPSFEDGFQVGSWIGSTDDDGITTSHHVFEHGIIYESLLHDECDLTEGSDDTWEDEGFQGAHMVADEDTWTIDVPECMDVLDMNRYTDGFEGFKSALSRVLGAGIGER